MLQKSKKSHANRFFSRVCNDTLLPESNLCITGLVGFISKEDKTRLQSVLDKAYRGGLYDTAAPPSFVNKSEQIDSTCFNVRVMQSLVICTWYAPHSSAAELKSKS